MVCFLPKNKTVSSSLNKLVIIILSFTELLGFFGGFFVCFFAAGDKSRNYVFLFKKMNEFWNKESKNFVWFSN